jgi:hypothetical protein
MPYNEMAMDKLLLECSEIANTFCRRNCTSVSDIFLTSLIKTESVSTHHTDSLMICLFISLSVCLSVCLSIALQPFVGPWPLFQFLDFYKSV